MSHLNDNKGTFWGKVRSSTNKLSSSLANLSIRSEHDGDSPTSTLIHKALVNHYVTKNEPFPKWLGEEESQQNQPSQQQQMDHSRNQQYTQNSAQGQVRQPVQTQRFQPQQSHQQQTGTSRFASRFAHEQQQQQAQQQQQQQQRQGSVGASSRFGGDNGAGSGSRFGGAANTGPSRSESSGSAMKDRLKRNNYRNNFGV